MKSKIIFSAIVLLILVTVLFRSNNFLKKENTRPKVYINDKISISVELADTDEKRSKGLSGKDKLGEKEGMFFVFEFPGKYGFWMKDMNFSIDIIWIDENNRIIYFVENVKPESYPKVYIPPKPALYVLEVNSGFIKKHNIQIGDMIDFSK